MIAGQRREAPEIDRAAIDPRGSARLQAPPREAERLQRLGEIVRRGLAGAPGARLLRTDVNHAVQKRAGRDDQRVAPKNVAALEREADRAIAVGQDASRSPENPLDVRLQIECVANPARGRD